MAGSAYFMPASDNNSSPTSDKIKWNDYNKRMHEMKLQRLALQKKQKLQIEGTKQAQKIYTRQQNSQYNQQKMAQNQQAFEGSWAGDVSRTSQQASQQIGQFAGVASGGQSFSQEQRALRQMFGHGESMWGFPESHGPDINNDLHPALNGDQGTADIFGFGGRGQRSGLF
jgi:hypothetical protein